MEKEIFKKIKESKNFEIYNPETGSNIKLPLYTDEISAGFPSPADDHLDRKLDLNEYLIKNKSATFLIKVNGNSMIDAGIYDGDILVVDRSLEPSKGKIIIGVINGEFTVKRIMKKGKKIFLKAENKNFKSIEITEDMDFKLWGIVSFSIHKL